MSSVSCASCVPMMAPTTTTTPSAANAATSTASTRGKRHRRSSATIGPSTNDSSTASVSGISTSRATDKAAMITTPTARPSKAFIPGASGGLIRLDRRDNDADGGGMGALLG
jgi:hypothetical protein